MPRHFLIPLDQSSFSERALTALAEVARPNDDRITLLEVVPSVMESFVGEGGRVITPAEQIAAREGQAQEYLEARAQVLRRRGYTVKIATDVGPPAETIVDHARIHRADMIVMCTHGHTGLTRVLRGSVANGVLAHAPCPVLLVPAHSEIALPV